MCPAEQVRDIVTEVKRMAPDSTLKDSPLAAIALDRAPVTYRNTGRDSPE